MTLRTTTKFVGELAGLSNRINFLERFTPEFYWQEDDKVYRRGWLPVACASDIPKPNDYVAREIPPPKTCLIVAHGSDVEILGFRAESCKPRV